MFDCHCLASCFGSGGLKKAIIFSIFFMILSSSRFPFSNQVVGHGVRVLMVNFSAVITPPMNEESPRDFRNGME
jgi:hypothetical protein